MGQELARFGVNWGEIFLRSIMTVFNTLIGLALIVLIGGLFFQEKTYGVAIIFTLMGLALTLIGWIRMVPVAQAIWQMQRVILYEKGFTVRKRGREHEYLWPTLTDWKIKRPFDYEANELMLVRGGHVVFYKGEDDVLHVTRLVFNGPRLVDMMMTGILSGGTLNQSI